MKDNLKIIKNYLQKKKTFQTIERNSIHFYETKAWSDWKVYFIRNINYFELEVPRIVRMVFKLKHD